jgi:hypothetical protein
MIFHHGFPPFTPDHVSLALYNVDAMLQYLSHSGTVFVCVSSLEDLPRPSARTELFQTARVTICRISSLDFHGRTEKGVEMNLGRKCGRRESNRK